MTDELLHKTLDMTFDAALERVPEVLKGHGFGVLATIDVSATFKAKLDVSLPGYMILGACNPKMAQEVLSLNPTAGVFLPCNVVVRQLEKGVEVRAVNPLETLGTHAELRDVAGRIRGMLVEVIAQL